MELGDKLSELHLTEEEVGRFAKAFKDDNFRKMLRDYAEEISDPENRKKYEEEIAILEQERGNSVQFIHPTPFKCVRTSVDGKHKGYVNVCANDKIGKPVCQSGVSADGRSGLNWSLPHSLHPERIEVDHKGNRIRIYDVVFHPDTLHMASTNKRFMDMVTSVAVQGIQDAFKVSLDKNNIKVMSIKYKGRPQACVIRKPVPGFKAKDTEDDSDPLAFPYPDNKATTFNKEKSKNGQSQPETPLKTQEPTAPHYTLKYRSYIDLQDFRCSRDSGRSPVPKEIIITIDLPLLKSVTAASLEVKERSLLLESDNPAYKLELPLAYAVDEDRGEAKFNRQTRQLVVTLPVRPPKQGLTFTNCPQESVSDIQDDDDEGNEIMEGVFEKESALEQDEHAEEDQDTDQSHEQRAAESKKKTAQEETDELSESKDEDAAQEEKKDDVEVSTGQNNHKLREEQEDGAKMEEQDKDEKGPATNDGHTNHTERDEAGEVKEEEEQARQENKMCCLETASDELQEEKTVKSSKSKVQISEDKKSAKVPACADDPGGASEPVRAAAELDEDDLKSEQVFGKASLPPVVLREMNEDGSHRVIADHVTSAGFSFHNSLLFELD